MFILVTGATGFLGAHIVHQLLDAGERVRAFVRPDRPRNHIRKIGVEFAEGDLQDGRGVEEACRGVDGVIHCAARLGYWAAQNKVQREINVEGTIALLRAAHAGGARRIVHVSSAAAIGSNHTGEILDEESPWSLENERISYARTKRRGEELALAAAWGGMPIVVVNPSMILGSRLDGRNPSALVRQIGRGRLPWIPPGGVSVTDVADIATAVVSALVHGRTGERYLLSGHNLTWEQLYRTIADATGGRAPERKLTQRELRWRSVAAGALDRLRLSRPGWTGEVFRSYGTYSWYRSDKAVRELAYAIRPLPRIVGRAVGRS
jgi:dihydroflavonol-4-reductase